jgi:hypothetical protein
MFLEWWMIGILIAMTAFWAEYRNKVGEKEGHTQGLADGAKAILMILVEDEVIIIDGEGIIHPKTKKREISRATKRPTTRAKSE